MGERSELPTQRRLTEARSNGQIAKSMDLTAAVDLVGGAILLLVFGSFLVGGLGSVVRYLLDDSVSGSALEPGRIIAVIWWAASRAVLLASPFVLIMFVIVAIAHVMQFGLVFSTQALQPKLDRLNPIAGISRLFKVRTLVKTGVNVVKLAVACVVTYKLVANEWPKIAGLSYLGAGGGYLAMLEIIGRILTWLLALLLIIGVADFAYQKWQHLQDMKMTKQQVKEEHKSMEGDPEIKGRRLRIARQMAMQRLQQSVPKADVVVTNPTHFSVALQYDPKTMSAPKVVAKGADFLAFRIREIAAANQIPIVERPPLARALYAKAPVGKQVSAEHYEAIAEILAYVYRLKNKAA